MFSIALFLPILALGKAVIANPLQARSVAPTEVFNAPIQVDHATALDTPVSTLSGFGNVTAARAGLQADAAQQVFPAYLRVCSGVNCGSGCVFYDLSELDPVSCYAGGFDYLSVEIVQPSNEGLPFGVIVANDCTGVLIPFVNTCYNISDLFSPYLLPPANTFFIIA